ncbi:NAD(P)-dependent alcohol dehydrogenase [Nocardioides panaciterrulae]|uniref:NADPH:quinone reductase-like Zn-dependent oxidoreductase n=1 Tax=Nocardioides panaciterrulae TaxID=661492 RepID=A0A7Y9JB92_9ACTN|nr:NAD(P)-dependent alcohol dehydrogenase [Nocardioides panaciterrulae]NYD42158.1 NADPH:quinone reductase-like Zn-dependent oxidoreductase [Nocardioides panaciterrulae]
MKAIVQDQYGGASTLTAQDVARPAVGDDDVLVQVVAAGVDRGALHFMTGRPYLMRLGTGLRVPKVRVPGVSFAGRVAAVGPHVAGIVVGEEVYGAGRGAYAEYVATPQGKVAPKPAELSFEEAAVLPYAAFAALQAVRDHGRVRPGERVLVVGASGAVGSIAVQVAEAAGAEVTAVCGPRGQRLAAEMGADVVIDYTREDFTDGSRHYDVILDVFGRTPIRRLRRALAPRGRLVIVGGEADRWIGGLQRQLGAMVLSPFVRQSLRVFVAKENADTLHQLNELVTAGQVRPVLGPSYPLVKAADAVATLQAGSASGRIVLMV